MFGSRHVWLLDDQIEKTEGGCTYMSKIKKRDNQIEFVTQRRSCPNKFENGDTVETLELKKDLLVYTFVNTANSKKSEFTCNYKREGLK